MENAKWDVLRTLIDRGKPELALKQLSVEAFIKLVADAERAPEIEKPKSIERDIHDELAHYQKDPTQPGYNAITDIHRRALEVAVKSLGRINKANLLSAISKGESRRALDAVLLILKGYEPKDADNHKPYPSIERNSDVIKALLEVKNLEEVRPLFERLQARGKGSGGGTIAELKSNLWWITGHFVDMADTKRIREWFELYEKGDR